MLRVVEEEVRMNVRYRVELSQTERAELTALLSGGRHTARKLKRAQILLAAAGPYPPAPPDPGEDDFEMPADEGGSNDQGSNT
jgi:hypothetical protein